MTYVITTGTIIIVNRMMIPITMHMRIFISFHHICFRTRLAPRRKPWAETAKLSKAVCSVYPDLQFGVAEIVACSFDQHTSLVLKAVKSRTAICNLVDVLAHYTNSIIDLLH